MISFLYFIMVAVGFAFYAASFIQSKPHKNVILENTFPTGALKSKQVQTLAKQYRKVSLYWSLLGFVLYLPMWLTSYDSLILLTLFLGMYLQMAGFYFLQVHFIGKMYQLKLIENWQLPVSETILVDTQLVVTKNRRLKPLTWFIPALLLSVLNSLLVWFFFHSWWGSFLILLGCLLFNGLFIFLYRVIANLPVKPLTENTQTNQKINDTYRNGWSTMLVVSANYLSLLPLFLISALLFSSPFLEILMSLTFISVLAYVVWSFWYLLKIRQEEDGFLQQGHDFIYRDEDRFWRYGIYNNPKDKRLNVPDRVGMNISLNFGRPLGKVIYGLLGIFLLGVTLFTTLPFLHADFSEDAFVGKITENTLYLKAPLAKSAEIPLKNIQRVESLKAVPNPKVRIVGSATPHYLTGTFQVAGKKAELYVYQKTPAVLRISTGQKDYYFAGKNAELTQKLQAQLNAVLNK